MAGQPKFWFRNPAAPGMAPRILYPLSALWELAARRRLQSGEWAKAPVPVICAGGLGVGGSGKTPAVIALVEALRRIGQNPHVITRGYGGSAKMPAKVDPARHTSRMVGDESLLLASFADTWADPGRVDAARLAAAGGATCVLLDDGFQNPSLRKDLSIVVVDAARGFGNGRVMPAGPLRENLESGLERADFLLSIGSPARQGEFLSAWGARIRKPVVQAELKALPTGIEWKGLRALAFAGIGFPEKFFGSLRELGVDLAGAVALSDHQELSPRLMSRLSQRARSLGAQLVTTEKDAVRLSQDFRSQVLTLPMRLEFSKPADLEGFLVPLFKP